MSNEFIAYVSRSKLPSTAELVRAMCSRGFLVEIESDAALTELAGRLPLRVDGAEIGVELAVGPVEAGAVGGAETDPQVARQVVKNTDLKLGFTGVDGADRWARDIARTVGLLACGAFANTGSGKLINYGR